MFGMSLAEIGVILVLALVILGPEKLPEVARTLGKTLREVRKAGNMLRDAIMLEEPPSKTNHQLTAPAAYQDDDAYDYSYHHEDEHYPDDYHMSGSIAHDPYAFSSMRDEVPLAPSKEATLTQKQVDLKPSTLSSETTPFDFPWQEEQSQAGQYTEVFLHEQLQEVS